MKYVGDDYEADMAKMKANPKVREWWEMTDGMQESLVKGAGGSKEGPDWWKTLEGTWSAKFENRDADERQRFFTLIE